MRIWSASRLAEHMPMNNDGIPWLKKVSRSIRAKVLSPTRRSQPGAYQYQPALSGISFEEATAAIERTGRRVIRSGVDSYSPHVVDVTRRLLSDNRVPLEEYRIDADAFARFRALAEYRARYPRYYGAETTEKHLEHFVTLDLLRLSSKDTFIDIASEDSPVPDIFSRLTGASTFWQDIQYEPGIHGRRIGGDACKMPIADGFATAAALTCSLEHFEGNSDRMLCEELGRIIRPDGRVVIAPLYLYPEPVTQTDPVYSAEVDVPFDPDVPIYCAKDWGNRHGRFYSPETLRNRVLDPLSAYFECCVKFISNYSALSDHTYLRFALFCHHK